MSIFAYSNTPMKLIDETTQKTAEVLKSLGHSTRIEILRLLSTERNRKIPVKEISERLGLTQSETSRHLIALKNASILSCLKESGSSYYSVSNRNQVIPCLVSCLIKEITVNEKKR